MSAAPSIGIVELGRVCDQQRAKSSGWFEALGRWVADEPTPALQRLYATGAHRHAWHADLWAGRRPTIPPVIDRPVPEPTAVDAGPDRVAAYRAGLRDMRRTLDELSTTIDPELDPSTVRVIGLVAADLDDLAAALDATDPGLT